MLKIEQKVKFDGIYRGKVVDNNDPLGRGRIKVEVYPMLVNVEKDALPWAVPAFPLWTGAGENGGSLYGFYAIPEAGSFVFVFFEAGDVYQPVYFAEAVDRVHGAPNDGDVSCRGFRTKAGIELWVRDSDKVIRIGHPSGTYIQVNEDGVVMIYSAKNIVIEGEEVHINP